MSKKETRQERREAMANNDYAAERPPASVEDCLVEQAYRRGYFQGYYQARENAAAGISLERMRKFVNEKLYVWRYGFRRTQRIAYPPRLEAQK